MNSSGEKVYAPEMAADLWLLLFAYHFPPENVIGALRPYRFAKYLGEHGIRCHVITAAEATNVAHATNGADAMNVAGVQARYLPDPFLSEQGGFGWQRERLFRKLLLPGATGVRWSRKAMTAADEFLADKPREQVTVFSTWPPLGTHLAGYETAKRHRLSWIADFRDPLARSPAYAHLGRHTNAIYDWLERKYIKTADAFIANTDEAARVLQARYPREREKVHLLWNGFDPQQRIEPLPISANPRRIFSHVGELYEHRTAAPLIASLDRLIQTGRLDPTSFLIQLIGPASPACLPEQQLRLRAEQQGWLFVLPQQVPKTEAQHYAQTSDGLLIIQPQSAIQVPGKVFEYVQIGRPLLVIVPPQSALERLLGQSGIPHQLIYSNADHETFDSAVLQYLALPSTPARPSAWFEETFNAQTQTAALARLIRAVQARRAG